MRMQSRPDHPVIRPPARGAAIRARIFALLRFSLLFWACSYFALVAISGHTYLRSIAFGLALVFALWLILGALFSDGEPIPVPDWYLWGALVAWSGWSAASVGWSLHPAYTKAEFGTEIGWGMATAAIFYVAARTGTAFRTLTVVAVTCAGFLSALAVFAAVTTGTFDPEHALARSHGGAGAFSTYLVLVIPLLPLLLAPKPVGFGAGPVALVDHGRGIRAAAGGGATDREPHDLGGAGHRIPRLGIARGMALARAARPRPDALGCASCWCSWCCSPCCSSMPPAGGRGPISSRTRRSRRRSPTIRASCSGSIRSSGSANGRGPVSGSASRSCPQSCATNCAIRCSRTRTICSSANGCKPAPSAWRRCWQCSRRWHGSTGRCCAHPTGRSPHLASPGSRCS